MTALRDTVFINTLRLSARVGVYAWEREVPQTLHCDVAMAWDTRAAARSECLEQALDYAAVVARIEAHAASRHFDLLETFAETCVEILMTEFHTPWVRMRCTKLQVLPQTGGVGIEIERGKR